MKILMFIFCIIIVISGCQHKDSLKNVTISPEIYTDRDTLFLKWNFKNNTSKNLIIPTLFTFRRLDGDDHRTYEYKVDCHIETLDTNLTIVVPYKYLKQIPDFGLDRTLHKQVKNLDNLDKHHYIVDRNYYNYIDDAKKCPEMVFVSAGSEKQIVFMFRPGISGKYSIGFLDKKIIERDFIRQRGDSLSKRGFPRLKDILSNRIDGYELEYGEFTLDSVEVNL